MYNYLIGCGIIAVLWLIMFFLRKDLQKPMVRSGFYYVLVLSIGFITIRLITISRPEYISIIPGYWNPDTLFNLGRITGGYSIEDFLYMFFSGGIVTFLYNYVFRKRIVIKRKYHFHFLAIIIGGLIALVISFLSVNLIWALIAFGAGSAIVIWFERKDLIKHSIIGGILYASFYFIFFSIFGIIFPHFVVQFYSIRDLSGFFVLGIPLEEIVFALSFGLSWAPIYEYIHGEKNVNIK
jgi:hypothetical protein